MPAEPHETVNVDGRPHAVMPVPNAIFRAAADRIAREAAAAAVSPERIVIGFDAGVDNVDVIVARVAGDGQLYIARIGDDGRPVGPFTPAARYVASDGLTFTEEPGDESPWLSLEQVIESVTSGNGAAWRMAAPDAAPTADDPERTQRQARQDARRATREHQQAVAATDDVLAAVDATIAGDCACGCGVPIDAESPSADFASQACQWRWSQRHADVPRGFYKTRDAVELLQRELAGDLVNQRYTDRPTDHTHIHFRAGGVVRGPGAAGRGELIAEAVRVLELVRAATRTGPCTRLMPVPAQFQLARCLERLARPDLNIDATIERLTCHQRMTPTLLGGGYTRMCDTCRRPVAPTVYETLLPDGPSILIQACPDCQYVFTPPGVVADMAFVADPVGDFIACTLSDGVRTVGDRMFVSDLTDTPFHPGVLVNAMWADLEQHLTEQQHPPAAAAESRAGGRMLQSMFPVINDPRAALRITNIV